MTNLKIKLLFVISFSAFSMDSYAAPSAIISWTAPTTYVNGTPLPATGIGYNIYQGLQGAAKTKVGSTTSLTYTVSTGLVPGTTVCFQVSTTLGTDESVLSNEACKPLPPSLSEPINLIIR